MRRARFLLVLGLSSALGPARADDVVAAVAANFTAPMKRIAASFERETGHRVLVSSGSTGALAAQIRNGAPFQVFLSADALTPAALQREGLAVAGSRFTYATGTLVLWSARPGFVDGGGGVLERGTFRHLAVADPKLAPYGAAAIQTMTRLGVLPRLAGRLVQGESIAQAHQFVASGNAELGFVALSQVLKEGRPAGGSMWVVPAAFHDPIRQDAVLLAPGRGKPAAEAFLNHLRAGRTRALLASFGYRP